MVCVWFLCLELFVCSLQKKKKKKKTKKKKKKKKRQFKEKKTDLVTSSKLN